MSDSLRKPSISSNRWILGYLMREKAVFLPSLLALLFTALLSLAVHFAVEDTVWPIGAGGWLSVMALGIGPVGAAFFTWDIGMKRGDIQLLGVASYAAPLLSTLALIAAGVTSASWTILAAAVLITGGAALAAKASAGGR